MAIDYLTLAETAKTLVDDAGRNVTLIALDFDAPDSEKPWRGPRNPRETPAQTLTVRAAFVPLSSMSTMGVQKSTLDVAKKADKTCLVGSQLDLSRFHEVLDSEDGKRYKILLVDELKPADVRLLSYLVLKESKE